MGGDGRTEKVGTKSANQPFVEYLEYRGGDCSTTVSFSLDPPLLQRTDE
jgi:hypothetical protein